MLRCMTQQVQDQDTSFDIMGRQGEEQIGNKILRVFTGSGGQWNTWKWQSFKGDQKKDFGN